MASAYGYIYSEEMYLWLARHYRAAGLQALEATAVQQASIISPTSPRVRTTRAGLDLMRGDTKGAAAEFRRILDQNPSDTTARMGLAALYHEAGDPTAALAMLEDPAAAADDVHIVSLRALVNLEAGHAVRARELFERARTLAGQDAQSLTLMALTAYGLSEFGLAKDYAERALPMNPRYLPLLQLLARVAEGEGNYARAVELMENMVDINPETITTRESLLALHMRQSEFDAGKEVANALLEIDPENFSANMALSDIASAAGRLADQEKYLREAIQNDEHPLYAYALNNLAYCLILQGRPEEAVPFASKAVEVNPGFDKAHHTLARAYKDLDRLDEARQEITKAITLAPADTNHDVLRAEIAYAAGQKDEARELITRVLPQLTGEWRVRGQQLLDDVR